MVLGRQEHHVEVLAVESLHVLAQNEEEVARSFDSWRRFPLLTPSNSGDVESRGRPRPLLGLHKNLQRSWGTFEPLACIQTEEAQCATNGDASHARGQFHENIEQDP